MKQGKKKNKNNQKNIPPCIFSPSYYGPYPPQTQNYAQQYNNYGPVTYQSFPHDYNLPYYGPEYWPYSNYNNAITNPSYPAYNNATYNAPVNTNEQMMPSNSNPYYNLNTLFKMNLNNLLQISNKSSSGTPETDSIEKLNYILCMRDNSISYSDSLSSEMSSNSNSNGLKLTQNEKRIINSEGLIKRFLEFSEKSLKATMKSTSEVQNLIKSIKTITENSETHESLMRCLIDHLVSYITVLCDCKCSYFFFSNFFSFVTQEELELLWKKAISVNFIYIITRKKACKIIKAFAFYTNNIDIKNDIISNLKRNIWEVASNKHGISVLMALLYDDIIHGYLKEFISRNLLSLSIHPHSFSLVKKQLSMIRQIQTNELIDTIRKALPFMLNNKYSISVLSYIFEIFSPQDYSFICDYLCSNFLYLTSIDDCLPLFHKMLITESDNKVSYLINFF